MLFQEAGCLPAELVGSQQTVPGTSMDDVQEQQMQQAACCSAVEAQVSDSNIASSSLAPAGLHVPEDVTIGMPAELCGSSLKDSELRIPRSSILCSIKQLLWASCLR